MAKLVFKYLLILNIAFKVKNGQSIQNSSRQSRFLVHPKNGGRGIILAYAIPIDLPRNVYMSHSFEVGYGISTRATDYFPGIFERFAFEYERSFQDDSLIVNDSSSKSSLKAKGEQKEKKTAEKPLISRGAFYGILIKKFLSAGFKGEECLLRMICEVNKYSIGVHNGVLGSIFEIIFSPITSMNERISNTYYEAENSGILGNCTKFEKKCMQSILDLFTN